MSRKTVLKTEAARARFVLRDALAGAKAVAPVLLGVAPFATVAGVAGVEAGFTPWQAVGMSLIVFAGAAQLAGIHLLGEGASALVVMLTAAVINLRFVMYSASIAPHFERAGSGAKALFAYLLTDQAYAVAVTRFREAEPISKGSFYVGAALAMWGTWQLGTAAGALVGAGVPEGWSLDFAVPLTFIALLVPNIKDRPGLFAALVGGGAAWGSLRPRSWALRAAFGQRGGAQNELVARLYRYGPGNLPAAPVIHRLAGTPEAAFRP